MPKRTAAKVQSEPTVMPIHATASKQLQATIIFGAVLVIAVAYLLVGPNLIGLGFSLAGFALGAVLTLLLFRRGYPHPSLGKGNLTTLTRMALVSSLLAPVFGLAWPWLIVAIAIFSLILDGVDGQLARREQRVSDFGARLDMEVDSAISVVLALNVISLGAMGAIVMLLALPRYLFVLAARALPWLNAPLPESLARKVVCVIQVSGLIALCAPVWPQVLVLPSFALVALLLLWSFGRDTLWLYRNRK
jgi:phosphatidylglycerophosphate synthase